MSSFDLDAFVSDLREAAVQEDAGKRVRALMNDAFRDPDAVKAAMSGYSGEEEILFDELGERIRDVRTGPDGAIYLLTDSANGSVLRIVPE